MTDARKQPLSDTHDVTEPATAQPLAEQNVPGGRLPPSPQQLIKVLRELADDFLQNKSIDNPWIYRNYLDSLLARLWQAAAQGHYDVLTQALKQLDRLLGDFARRHSPASREPREQFAYHILDRLNIIEDAIEALAPFESADYLKNNTRATRLLDILFELNTSYNDEVTILQEDCDSLLNGHALRKLLDDFLDRNLIQFLYSDDGEPLYRITETGEWVKRRIDSTHTGSESETTPPSRERRLQRFTTRVALPSTTSTSGKRTPQ